MSSYFLNCGKALLSGCNVLYLYPIHDAMFGFESNKDFRDPEINAFALIQFEAYWGVFHLRGFLYASMTWGVATHAKMELFWRLLPRPRF